MKLYNSVYAPTFITLTPNCQFVHKLSSDMRFPTVWHLDKTSLDSDKTVQLLLSLETPNDVRSVA